MSEKVLRWSGAALVAGAVFVAAGCSGSSTTVGGGSATASASTQHTSSHHRRRHKHHHHRRAPRATHAAGWQGLCPPSSHVLDGVYHPERLNVLSPCRIATGTVDVVRTEEDGDLHFDITLDSAYRSLLARGNAQQNGNLVVEFMPRDDGHLPAPQVGDRVTLVGAWVDDTDHAWNEFHPVWAAHVGGGSWHRSGPQFGGSPPRARSYDALSTCQTAGGGRCRGYGGAAAGGTDEGSASHGGGSSPTSGSGTNCDPNYKGACLDPTASDYDCAGGSGDGPKYVQGPIRVVGDDHYHLDANGDGIACSG